MRVIAGFPGAKSHRVVTRKRNKPKDQADLLHRTGPILLCDEGGAFGNGSSSVRDPPACCANGTDEVVWGQGEGRTAFVVGSWTRECSGEVGPDLPIAPRAVLR